MSLDSATSALDDLRAAVAGRAPREVGRDAVYRMLAGGGDSSRRTSPPAAEYSAALDDALDRLPAAFEQRERMLAEAAELARSLAETGRTSPAEARSRAVRSPIELRPDIVRALVRLAEATALDEPEHGIVIAGVAVAAAEATRPATGDIAGQDLRAAARCSLAEAAFRGGDLVAAEGALAEARRLAETGTGDPLLRAELLRLESEIRTCQSRFGEARRLAELSVAIFRRRGDRRREGRGRVSLAAKLAYEGRLDDALAETDRALPLIDAERDGRWLLAAEFNRALALNNAGDSAAARTALPRLRELVAAHGRELDRVRLDWLAAGIATVEGELERAAELYRPVLARCLELETIYDSALVALELAVVLLELGRTDEVLALSNTVEPIFRVQGVEPEAAAALLLAAESLRHGAAAREVLAELVAARRAARSGR
jgi:hypothetical protein